MRRNPHPKYKSTRWAKAIAQYADDPDVFISFQPGIKTARGVVEQKLGVRPTRGLHHKDPRGVFAYPAGWLHHALEDMYANDMPQYTIFRLDRGYPGVVISENGRIATGRNDLRGIAYKNNWGEVFDGELQDPSSRHIKNRTTTGGRWYNTAKMLVMQERAKWGSLLRGVAWVEDDDTGSIHPNEPAQLVVLDMRAIHILEQAEADAYTKFVFKEGRNYALVPPEVLNAAAKRAPMSALQYAAKYLSIEDLSAAAQEEPIYALKYAAQYLSPEDLSEAKRRVARIGL